MHFWFGPSYKARTMDYRSICRTNDDKYNNPISRSLSLVEKFVH